MPKWFVILLAIALGATLAVILFNTRQITRRQQQALEDQRRRIELLSLEITTLQHAHANHQAEQSWLRETQSLLARFLINRLIWPRRTG